MLSVTTSGSHGCSRREVLKIGSLAMGGLSLPALLQLRQALAADPDSVRDKSVVFLFMHGGPPQTETFDPKMSAPLGVRSFTGEIATKLPGVTFGSTMQKLAPLADRLAIVRSFATGDGNHDVKPITRKQTGEVSLGALYSRIAGANHPQTGMPRSAALFPRAIDPKSQAAVQQFGSLTATGELGTACTPFIPGAGSDAQKNLELNLPRGRFDDRRALLVRLDAIRRAADRNGSLDSLDTFQLQAFETLVGGAADAFDLGREDARTIARYDTAPLVHPNSINRRWNNYDNYVDHGKTLGKLMLLARRLCEAGCGFVTISTSFVWDMHADSNNATLQEGMEYCGKPFDHAVAAFLEDVRERGLSDKILLIACGEMGRTPKMNNRGGRDHWGRLAPLLLAGGGLEMGQVIGQSNADAGEPAADPVTIDNLTATIMHNLFDIGRLRTVAGIPNDVLRIVLNGTPIPQLV